ncbi:MAG: GldG family protein [Kiritimatiellaeota bacterium]|nr:GldG family protein [Kiritimatiellota bacterium]
MQGVSERTRDVLANTQGAIKISCLMDRRDPMYRPVVRLMKGIRTAARGVAGAEIKLEFVDPRWDLMRAGQLAAYGVAPPALLFERQHRRIAVTVDEMMTVTPGGDEGDDRGRGVGVFRGEMVCASAIARLALPTDRPVVYWLQGHGEARHDDYDALRGFSDIAREMTRDGYDIRPLALAGQRQMPEDCRVLMVAGAVRVLAAEECDLIRAFLQRGGRMLYMAVPRHPSGLEPLLEQWGVRVTPFVAASRKTLSGQDVVVSAFADHASMHNLRNASVVFGNAACLEAVAAAEGEGGVDRPQVTLLAMTDEDGWGERGPDAQKGELTGPVALAAAAERGGGVAPDVAYNPTRIGVIGEAGFVANGALTVRANANRDFFMNVLAWLAGIDVGTASSLGGDAVLVTGFTRDEWTALLAWSAGGVPLLLLVLMAGAARIFRW